MVIYDDFKKWASSHEKTFNRTSVELKHLGMKLTL